MEDQLAELLFLMLASLWVAYSAITTSFKIINEVRDKIIQGKNSVADLSMEHRKLIFNNDWVIMNFGTAVILFVYAVIIFFIPNLLNLCGEMIAIFFYITALLPLFGSFGFMYGGIKDYHYIKGILNGNDKLSK